MAFETDLRMVVMITASFLANLKCIHTNFNSIKINWYYLPIGFKSVIRNDGCCISRVANPLCIHTRNLEPKLALM